MADINENQPDQAALAQQELASQMALALGNALPGTGDPNATAAAAALAAEQKNDPPPFTFELVKEKFGYNAPEDMMTEIEQLRALKENPPTATYEFENEESKNLFQKFAKGDKESRRAVADFLNEQLKLEELLDTEVNKDVAAEIVKHGLKVKYKDLTKDQIDYTFKKQFGIPPKPVQKSDEEKESYDERVAAWQEIANDKQMELTIEAIKLKPELATAKAKLVFPEIEQQTDEGYLNYKKAIEEDQRLSAEAVKAYSAFTPEMLASKLDFNDKANGVSLTYSRVPDAESFAKTMKMVNNIDEFYALFHNQDGTPDRVKFATAIDRMVNFDKILTDAMNQSKNATLKSLLPDNSQNRGLVRQLVNTTMDTTEVDEGMKAAGIKRS